MLANIKRYWIIYAALAIIIIGAAVLIFIYRNRTLAGTPCVTPDGLKGTMMAGKCVALPPEIVTHNPPCTKDGQEGRIVNGKCITVKCINRPGSAGC